MEIKTSELIRLLKREIRFHKLIAKTPEDRAFIKGIQQVLTILKMMEESERLGF